MRTKTIAVTGAVLCLAGISAPAHAQDKAARMAATELAARVPFEKQTKGAPYSAELLIEGSQSLADGNRINRRTTGRVYRDSEGRTRREEDRQDGSVAISIADPIAGYSYSLDSRTRTAWRTAMGPTGEILRKLEAAQAEERRRLDAPQMDERRKVEARKLEEERKVEEKAILEQKMKAAAGDEARLRIPDGKRAPLERKTLEGLAVEGRRNTTVIPAGQVGNELPMTIVSEEWRSPELNVLVMTRHSDPRMGESTYRLQNIVRAEPDRSLFMVPADYTVKDTNIKRLDMAQK